MREDALGQLKLKYNKVLERQNKAEAWINENRPDDKSKYYIEYMSILKQLNKLIGQAAQMGYTMSHSEIVGGFND